MSQKNDEYYSQVKQLGLVTTIPIILVVGPIVGFLFGGWIDRKANCYPWVTIVFVLLGFAASGKEVVRLLKIVSKTQNETKKKNS